MSKPSFQRKNIDFLQNVGTYQDFIRLSNISIQKRIQDHITSDDQEKIFRYLKNPTSCGIWILKGTWLENKGFTSKISEELISQKLVVS